MRETETEAKIIIIMRDQRIVINNVSYEYYVARVVIIVYSVSWRRGATIRAAAV